MTVHHLNTSLYFDIINRLMPKMEDRSYCIGLQDALKECREKNHYEHLPCKKMEEFIKKIECYSFEPRPLYSVQKHDYEFAKVLGKK